jgi:hypothetical protein
MPLDVVPVLLKQYKEKGVAKSVAERLKALAPLLEQAATPQQKATVLARATGIGDDLLAHWLQRLSGRQIVLLLDTPLAAAFAPPQTGAAPAGDRPAPQLLADPVERLKGLGQREIALLGACGANPGGVLRVEDQLSLQTHCLVRALAALPGPITLEQAHEHTAKTLAEVFAAANEKRRAEGKEPLPPYQPYLVNTCSRPVVLKP